MGKRIANATVITSAATSVNRDKIPTGYRLAADYIRGRRVLDYGAGKWDNAIAWATKTLDATVWAYDPYNRPAAVNRAALKRKYDAVICNNVLNVIADGKARKKALQAMAKLAPVVLVTVYEGNGTGAGRQTGPDTWQENRRTADYIPEIVAAGYDVDRHGKLLVCRPWTPERKAEETRRHLEAIRDAVAEEMQVASPEELRAALWEGITQKHAGKMEGICSFSTCATINSACAAMSKIPGYICSKCYAESLLSMRPGLAEKAARNTALITTYVLPMEAFPVLPWSHFRFEAFGDLAPGAAGVIQARNYLRWALRNPGTVFAWWTKHPGTVLQALALEGLDALPDNVNLIYSVYTIDAPDNVVDLYRRTLAKIPGSFAIFAVYTDPGRRQNCPKSCRDCLRCYTRRDPDAGPVQIVEKLK